MMFCLLFLAFACTAFASLSSDSACQNEVCHKFKTYGQTATKSFLVTDKQKLFLTLVAAGMRRKSLVVMEVDVYQIGFFVSDEKDSQLLKMDNSKGISGLTERLMEPNGRTLSAGIALTFVRDVETSKVVDAIVEAMSAPGDAREYNAALNKFSKLLQDSIGSAGMKKKDEISFAFYGKSYLGISLGEKFVGVIDSAEIRSRLAAVYVGDKSVSPELVKVLRARYLT